MAGVMVGRGIVAAVGIGGGGRTVKRSASLVIEFARMPRARFTPWT